MPVRRRADIVEILRRRLLTAVRAGTLLPGARLPSARQAAARFETDPRVVLAAYGELQAEGLVEIRERSGIFLAEAAGDRSGTGGLTDSWVADILTAAIAREVSALDVADEIQRRLRPGALLALVVAGNADQREGLIEELRADYGLKAQGQPPNVLERRPLPRAVGRADLVVATSGTAEVAQAAATLLGIPCIVIGVRADLLSGDWRHFGNSPVHVVSTDAQFVEMARLFLNAQGNAAKIHPVVLGRDPLESVPADATVYITRAARTQLDGTFVPGRIVPPIRLFASATSRELLETILRLNAAADAAASPARRTRRAKAALWSGPG